jgi:hypothetical protein
MDYPRSQIASAGQFSATADREEEIEAAHLADRSWGIGP